MSAPVNRLGHVAIIVTAREYQALAAATALHDVTWFEGQDPTPEQRGDQRALTALLQKCRDAGIRTGAGS